MGYGGFALIDFEEAGGVFAPLQDEEFFKKVHVGDHGQIAWTDEIEICPDAAYLEITGKISREAVHA